MSAGGGWLARLGGLDRRWIYATLAAAIVAALLTGMRFPDSPSALVAPLYEAVEALPPGAPVLLACDYSPASAPELEPMAFALARHALLRRQRLILISLWDTGNIMIGEVVERVIRQEFPDREQGVDWIALGYKAGNEKLIVAVRDDFRRMYTTDLRGESLASLPAMAGIGGLRDVALIVSLSSGYPGLKEWILFAGDALGVPVAGGSTGVGAPEFFAYFPRQLFALLPGLKGAAEYETALERGHPEFAPRTRAATDNMGPQAVAHGVIIVFILLGNAGLLASRHRRRGSAP